MAKHEVPVETAERPITDDAQEIIQNALTDNPEVLLVLEIAQRARELEATIIPVSMEPTGDLRPTASISSPALTW